LALAQAHAVRMASAQSAAAAPTVVDSLAAEVQAISRKLGLPRVSHERLARTPEAVLAQVNAKLTMLLAKLPPDALRPQPPLLPPSHASPECMALLGEVNAALAADYSMRRELLLKRLDVTVQVRQHIMCSSRDVALRRGPSDDIDPR
jgi:hypothetical protein